MKCAIRLIFLNFSIIVLCACVVAQTGKGNIAGIVLDPEGQPLSQATITVRSISRKPLETRVSVKTDKIGHFAISNCPFGSYMVLIAKEQRARSGVNAVFSENPIFTTVLLSSTFPTSTLSFKFGRNTGIVSGTIKDNVTGRPMNARLGVKSAGSSDYWLVTGLPEKFRIQVPITGDVLFAVSAPGYQTWYPGQGPTSSLRVGLGSKKIWNILMQPLPK